MIPLLLLIAATAFAQVQAADQPSLFINGRMDLPRLEPSQGSSGTVSVYNSGARAANVGLSLTLPGDGTFTDVRVLSGDAACTRTTSQILCTAGELDTTKYFQIQFRFTAPGRLDGGTFVVHATTAADQPDVDFADNTLDLRSALIPHLLVTNPADEGAGSLRQALIEARTRCATEMCTIDFRIPGPPPAGGWFTIEPRGPMEVDAIVNLRGETQTAFGGDTNPDGPEIEINGSLLTEGDGLLVRSPCWTTVTGLTINGYPRHAIEVHREKPAERCPEGLAIGPTISNNYLGTDPRGLTAVPNERGVVVSAGESIYIHDNLISGNRRAGIFLSNLLFASIQKNRIGINANGEPLGNGASGIFVDVPFQGPFYGNGAEVLENVIAYNGEWGICRTPSAEVAVSHNSIFGNLVSGIDIGLDFETPNRADDSLTNPNKPVLFSAMYDPVAQATLVRGRLDSNPIPGFGGTFYLDVYASSSLSVWGFPQGEQMVMTKAVPGHSDFEIAVPGDLRGTLITATNTRRHYIGFAKPPLEQSHLGSLPAGDTSEFSNAIEVR